MTLLPARCLPDPSRRLFTRTGFFSPSLDGGLPLFELFESEPALDFRDPCFQRRVFSPQRRNQRDQFLPDGSLSVSQ